MPYSTLATGNSPEPENITAPRAPVDLNDVAALLADLADAPVVQHPPLRAYYCRAGYLIFDKGTLIQDGEWFRGRQDADRMHKAYHAEAAAKDRKVRGYAWAAGMTDEELAAHKQRQKQEQNRRAYQKRKAKQTAVVSHD